MSTYSCILCKLLAFCANFTIYTIYISSSSNYSCISGDVDYPIYIEFHLVYFIMFFVHLMWDICTYFVSYMHSMHDWHTLPLRLWVYITVNTYVVLLIVVCNEFNFFAFLYIGPIKHVLGIYKKSLETNTVMIVFIYIVT